MLTLYTNQQKINKERRGLVNGVLSEWGLLLFALILLAYILYLSLQLRHVRAWSWELQVLRGLRQSMIEKMSGGENFSLVVEKEEDGQTEDIAFIHVDGRRFDPSSYCDKKISFFGVRKLKGFRACIGEDSCLIVYDRKWLRYPTGFLFGVLHEIGHVAYREKTGNKALCASALEEPHLECSAREERFAWAFAIRALRALEEEGWNTFSRPHVRQSVRKCVGASLKTYDSINQIVRKCRRLRKRFLDRRHAKDGRPVFFKKKEHPLQEVFSEKSPYSMIAKTREVHT